MTKNVIKENPKSEVKPPQRKSGGNNITRGLGSFFTGAFLSKERAIIFHSSKKMSIKWSEGCFALPEKKTRKIIDIIKGGSLVYAYK